MHAHAHGNHHRRLHHRSNNPCNTLQHSPPLRKGAWRGVEFGNWFEEDGGNGGRGGVGVAMERSCRRSCRW
ncbi:hypothetical protein KC19_8G123500 [Ceratodon purpureus]|uniref:Uncharacterized protein n=1 Tax=Ceratodon purpureus TaxID=3225 RepID=A0A8T0H653_CERPU|nr:hypothetical protein KC19_8G123500 [Ceratodon purpureus]